jgi:hypothetical protein
MKGIHWSLDIGKWSKKHIIFKDSDTRTLCNKQIPAYADDIFTTHQLFDTNSCKLCARRAIQKLYDIKRGLYELY